LVISPIPIHICALLLASPLRGAWWMGGVFYPPCSSRRELCDERRPT